MRQSGVLVQCRFSQRINSIFGICIRLLDACSHAGKALAAEGHVIWVDIRDSFSENTTQLSPSLSNACWILKLSNKW